MALDKASGIYRTLTDKSIVINASQEIKAIVPMLTTKGAVGKLTMVTAKTLEDVVGYDVVYNPNYYGLKEICNNQNYVYVWRLNQDATLGNLYFKAASKSSVSNADSFDAFDVVCKDTSNAVVLGVGYKTPGSVGRKAVKFVPTLQTSKISYKINDSNKYVFEVDGVSTEEALTSIPAFSTDNPGDTRNAFAGISIYDATGNSKIGILQRLSTKTGDVWDVNKIVNGVIVEESVGTATITGNKIEFELDAPFNDNIYWIAKYYDSEYNYWTMYYADWDGTSASNPVLYDFSINANDVDADNYFENMDFGDLKISVASGFNVNSDVRSYNELLNGSNGALESELDLTKIDIGVLKLSKCNMMYFNGFGVDQPERSFINEILKGAAKYNIHSFVDTPSLDYIDLSEWCKDIYKSEYVTIASRPEIVKVGTKTLYVYCSVKYSEIYSRMLANTRTMNYPPAGFTYGQVTASKLPETDFDLFGDELKTDRINYIISDTVTCMWEQRTTYEKNSDLSYIASVFILDSLSDNLVQFEKTYTFLYSSPEDLLLQRNGLDGICSSFAEAGFIWNYEIDVPSFEDVKKDGSREIHIKVGVQIAKDQEVIYLDIVLNK